MSWFDSHDSSGYAGSSKFNNIWKATFCSPHPRLNPQHLGVRKNKPCLNSRKQQTRQDWSRWTSGLIHFISHPYVSIFLFHCVSFYLVMLRWMWKCSITMAPSTANPQRRVRVAEQLYWSTSTKQLYKVQVFCEANGSHPGPPISFALQERAPPSL